MKNILTYILLSSICSGAFYFAYKIIASKDSFFTANRLTILGSLIASILLPFISWSSLSKGEASPINELIYAVNLNEIVVSASTITPPNWSSALITVYVVGATLILLILIGSLVGIARSIFGADKVIRTENYTLLLHKKSNLKPFSWMSYIILSHQDYENHRKEIIMHENAHIHFRHSWDILLLHIIATIQWFNPFVWLWKAELRRVHEYQADQYVLQSGINAQLYQLLLIKKSVGDLKFNLANNFSRRDLSKRIKMMLKEKTNSKKRWKYVYTLPLCLAMVFVVGKSKTLQAQPVVNLPTAENTVTQPPIAQTPKDTAVFMVVEDMPEFPGGIKKMMEYIGENIVYPRQAAKDSIQGRVIVEFTVNTDGAIVDPRIVRGVEPSLDEVALNVVQNMPKWKPGKQGGKEVRVRYTLPVTFRLKQPEKTEQ